jgi:hypothetical protein
VRRSKEEVQEGVRQQEAGVRQEEADGADRPRADRADRSRNRTDRPRGDRARVGRRPLAGPLCGARRRAPLQRLGGRLYTGGFDSFFISAACSDGSFDSSAIAPVQASIAANGDFAGSGVYSPGFGQQIPWQLSGNISGKAITEGTFTAGPYTDFFGHSCGGTTHFTGQWIAAYTL